MALFVVAEENGVEVHSSNGVEVEGEELVLLHHSRPAKHSAEGGAKYYNNEIY